MHGEPYGISFYDLLQIFAIFFRHSDIGQFFKLRNILNGDKFIFGDDLFQDGNKKKLWKCDAVYFNGRSISTICAAQFFCKFQKKASGIIFIACCF